MKKMIDIFTWILTVFMFLAALMYFPSVASIFMLLFSAVALPISAVRNFWASKRLTGAVKIAVLVVLFLIGIYLAPTKPADEPKDDVDKVVENQQNEEEEEPSEPEEPEETTLNGKHTLPSGMEFLFVDNVRNDTTGRWRRAVTSDSYVPADYALEYYQQMFSSDDEIHAIWNATLKTTTRISASNGLLFVDTFEYVDGEEHDAKMLFTGTKLDSRIIDIATGEPYEPEAEPAPTDEPEPEQTTATSTTEPPIEAPAPAPEPAEPASSSASSGGSWGESKTTDEITGDLSDTVYWTSGGKSYHFSENCATLSRSNNIKSGTLQDALNAGKKDPCNICAGG